MNSRSGGKGGFSDGGGKTGSIREEGRTERRKGGKKKKCLRKGEGGSGAGIMGKNRFKELEKK